VTTVLDRYGHLHATDTDRVTDRLAALFVSSSPVGVVVPLRP